MDGRQNKIIVCENSVTVLHLIECREWRNGTAEIAAFQLIDEHVNEKDTVVYKDGSVHRVNRSGWGFLGQNNSQGCC